MEEGGGKNGGGERRRDKWAYHKDQHPSRLRHIPSSIPHPHLRVWGQRAPQSRLFRCQSVLFPSLPSSLKCVGAGIVKTRFPYQSTHKVRVRPAGVNLQVGVEGAHVRVRHSGARGRDVAEGVDGVGLGLRPGEDGGAGVAGGGVEGFVGGGHGMVVGSVAFGGDFFGGWWWCCCFWWR